MALTITGLIILIRIFDLYPEDGESVFHSFHFMKLFCSAVFILAYILIAQPGYCQDVPFYKNDTGREQSYYLKPVIGWFGQKSDVNGDVPFQKLTGSPAFKPIYGLMVGYRRQTFDLETGLLRLPVYAGFFFPSLVNTTSFLGFSKANSTSYRHIPLKIRFNSPFHHKKISVGVMAGVAYNRRDTTFQFANPAIEIRGIRDKNGTEIAIKSITYTYYKTSFFSGEIGLTGTWQPRKRFSLSLEIKQFFSASDIVSLSSAVEQNNSPAIFKVTARGGANGQSVMLGASCYF